MYVIAGPCTDVNDKACAGERPAGCIHEGERMLCTHPGECADGGRLRAGLRDRGDLLRRRRARAVDLVQLAGDAKFSGQLSSPGGAAKTGPLLYDTDYIASHVTGRRCTLSVRPIPDRGRASGGPAPGSPAARATQPANR